MLNMRTAVPTSASVIQNLSGCGPSLPSPPIERNVRARAGVDGVRARTARTRNYECAARRFVHLTITAATATPLAATEQILEPGFGSFASVALFSGFLVRVRLFIRRGVLAAFVTVRVWRC